MASAPAKTTDERVDVTVSLPADVLRGIDASAARTGETRSYVVTAAARRYLLAQERWRHVQAIFSEAAREAGLREDDVEDYLDSLPAPSA